MKGDERYTKLGLNVCVEGIESEAIQNVIESLHPDTLQGYFYSRPVNVETFEKVFLRKDLNH